MKIKKSVLLILFFSFVFSFNAFAGKISYDESGTKYTIPWGKAYDYTNILVTRVVNINSVQLETGERLVLIGVEPIAEFNEEALDFLNNLVKGKRIQLEFDEKRYDSEGRILAYAYLVDNNLFINKEIISKGFARAYATLPNVRYNEVFLKAEKEARDSKTGLWN